MAWLEIIHVAAGITSVVSLCAVFAVLFIWAFTRSSKERSLREIIDGEGIGARELKVISAIPPADRLAALQAKYKNDRDRAKRIDTKIKANIDVNGLTIKQQKDRTFRFLIVGVLFLGLAVVAWVSTRTSSAGSEPPPAKLTAAEPPPAKLTAAEQQVHELRDELVKLLNHPDQIGEEAPGLARAFDKTNEYAMNLGNAILRLEYAGYTYVLAAEHTDDEGARLQFANLAVERTDAALLKIKDCDQKVNAGIDRYYLICQRELRENEDEERCTEVKAFALAIIAKERGDQLAANLALETWLSLPVGYRRRVKAAGLDDKWMRPILQPHEKDLLKGA